MLIIIDKRAPDKAKNTLSAYGDIIEFSTSGITYDTISGHPDIFFCHVDENLIIAPNIPHEYLQILNSKRAAFVMGEKHINENYPDSAVYNAVLSDNYLIHRLDITDPVILKYSGTRETINIKQGYSRCSLLPLKKENFITSDMGIYNEFKERRLNVQYINPEGIQLPGHSHGFFGGACGIYNNNIFVTGSLRYLENGNEVNNFITSLGYKIIELYDGPLYDGGSILFID